MKGRGRLRVRSWWKLGTFVLLFALTCFMGVYALTPAAQANPEELMMDIDAAPAGARPDTGVVPVLSKGVTAGSAGSTAPTGASPMPTGASPTPMGAPPTPTGALPAPATSTAQNAAPKASPSPAASQSPAATPDKPVETTAPAAEPKQGSPDLPYYLYFEKQSFTLTIYELDANGAYTKVYKTYRAAHGGNKTPAGTFTLGARDRWHEFPDGGFAQFATRYHARLYIHSPLYGSENAGYMWPKYYDGELGIGKVSTGGCLRMVTEAARFIYENCPEGTVFEIVNGSPKNTTSDELPSRNGKRYDPTDVEMTG